MNPEKIMTIKETANFLKVKPVTIYKLLALKKIPGMKISGAWRFRKDILEDWIDNDCVYKAESEGNTA